MAPKIPAPITAPIASMMRSPAPRTRFSPLALSSITAIGFRAKSEFMRLGCVVASDEQRREHERDRAEQLDEHVQRRTRCVLERIADRVAHHRRLVCIRALAAVRTGLDVLLRVVPGAATVVQEAR